MYLKQHTFLVLLLHQCIVNGFNIFDMDTGFNFLNRKINSLTSSITPDTEIETRWILQELDHFNSKDSRNFQMKYFEGLKYWRKNGPIYLFLEGQGRASMGWASYGIMNELAKETHGAMYITEHRYYGDSKPFMNLDAKNIKYLSSRQALADIAKLISFLKSLPMFKDSKVVVIGGFYGGKLAAWMKVIYPKLIDAAISSSAPVLAQKDFFEYLENIKNNYVHYAYQECLDNITKIILNYDLMLQNPEGIKQFKRHENICDSCDMTNIENQHLFFFYVTLSLSSIAEDLYILQHFCGKTNNKNDYSSFLNEYSKVNNSYTDCAYYNFQDRINDTKDRRNLDWIYPYLYQSCTEFGHFPTTSSMNQPFLNIPLEFYMKICSGLFGDDFTEKRLDEGIVISNKLYGGLKPNVTNVVFTNGELDPWSTLSVLKDLSQDAKAVILPGVSRCQDLFPEKFESKEVKAARQHVKYLIRKWIGVDEYSN